MVNLFFQKHPDFNIYEDRITSNKQLNPEDHLGASEKHLFEALSRSSKGFLPRNALVRSAIEEGVEEASFDFMLDGLDDIEELNYYNNGNSNDPSGDNYEYYLQRKGGILNRYKNYNGTQGNSPINVSSEYRGSTTLPDVEDVNNDNTMNRVDSYFEYKIPLLK